MLEHIQAEYPLEGCGLLAGQEGQVVWGTAVPNILHSETAYEMDALLQIKAMLEIETQGWELLAIYHSHPQGPETPSATDIAQATYPEAVYLIISLADWSKPVVRGFTIWGDQVTEIAVTVE